GYICHFRLRIEITDRGRSHDCDGEKCNEECSSGHEGGVSGVKPRRPVVRSLGPNAPLDRKAHPEPPLVEVLSASFYTLEITAGNCQESGGAESGRRRQAY